MEQPEKILKKWYNPLHGIGEIAELQIVEAMKEYAIEVAKEALKNASESADIEEYDVTRKKTYVDKWGKYAYAGDESEVIVRVNKQSILNESNIPTL